MREVYDIGAGKRDNEKFVHFGSDDIAIDKLLFAAGGEIRYGNFETIAEAEAASAEHEAT